jgi:peptidoglycan/LPS O-acetylase OafA/YrhL
MRAVSIALVVIGHAFNGIYPGRFPTFSEPLRLVFGNSGLGVSVFFVISGFLITRLLLDEQRRTGTIRLRAFYLRRFWRLFPAAYTYIAFVAACGAAGVLTVTRHDLLSAFGYVWNYLPGTSWALTHLWSLSLEEQFYLLWPGALLLLGPRSTRLAVALVLLAPLARVATALFTSAVRVDTLLHTRMDTLMFGCLAALLFEHPAVRALRRRWTGRLAPFALAFLVATPFLVIRFGGAYLYVVGHTLEGLAITVLLLWAVDHPSTLAGRVLNSRPLVAIGVGSYSIYLWQTFFLDSLLPLRLPVPAKLACIAVAASVSYVCIERPFLRWRDRPLPAAELPRGATAAA